MVKQVLIAAGGHGTRMSAKSNPYGSKVVMEYAGQSMLGHLIDDLMEGGVTEYLVTSGTHNNERVKEIVRGKKVNSIIETVEADSFRHIPWLLRDLLDDKFMFVCGHHPLTKNFVREMIEKGRRFDAVISAYDGSVYPYNKDTKIIFEEVNGNPLLRRVDHHVEGRYLYVRNPYIIGRDVVDISRREEFAWTFSHYIYRNWFDGSSLGVVKAPMPPEFDFDAEFETTKRFLDSLKI